VQYKAGGACEKNSGKFLIQRSFLVGSFHDFSKWFEQVAFQSEVEVLADSKNISPSSSRIVKRPEILQ
jgi:hypothetical protein